ncbi:heat-shock protein Hsp20 [Siccirubricoccus deserti]|uniref:Hsp20 family protein n=1 Tax=Siccirubricoccus deserti TaxID=2013562 RepID=A0A9X0UFY3_9PROT|nr:Hsp20 family protein [Siccirubricoccus deserti]MBC4014830.1 Hsp20 family protein [Siccirubricoccus deserti]GGC35387.1 heat-shock protein Hsp20 [Siccirubricoccus deserti]
MNALDFSPLFRTAIGFDRLARVLETARTSTENQGYPPYNIEKTGEDTYVLTMAVAGFGEADLDIVARDNVLTITGRAPQPEEGRSFLHRGIAGRAFERRFVLADHIVVDGAQLENGLLQLGLKRVVPEALKPRRIEVQSRRPALANDAPAPQADNTQAPQAAAA